MATTMGEAEALEGLFGNSPEAKLWDFLIGTSTDFTKKELAEGAEISRATLYKILSKFLEWKTLIKTRKIGNVELYKLNKKNPVVKAIDEFNNVLIDIITQEELEKETGQIEKGKVIEVIA
ncbi:MAG: hypothetical protein L6408_06505 [Nanoarchaeota archaeon]|nr:hypothetical protein [Nanoarchaeota archaeon]